MPENLENSAVATGLEKVIFIPIPKKGNAKERSNYRTIALISHFHALEKEMATHSSVLPGESQGRGSLVGCRLWGRTESDTTEVT